MDGIELRLKELRKGLKGKVLVEKNKGGKVEKRRNKS